MVFDIIVADHGENWNARERVGDVFHRCRHCVLHEWPQRVGLTLIFTCHIVPAEITNDNDCVNMFSLLTLGRVVKDILKHHGRGLIAGSDVLLGRIYVQVDVCKDQKSCCLGFLHQQ